MIEEIPKDMRNYKRDPERYMRNYRIGFKGY